MSELEGPLDLIGPFCKKHFYPVKSNGAPLIQVGVQVLDLPAWPPPLICLKLQRRRGKPNKVTKDHGILGGESPSLGERVKTDLKSVLATGPDNLPLKVMPEVAFWIWPFKLVRDICSLGRMTQ